MTTVEASSINIKLEDQQRINAFSKMHQKQKELSAELLRLDEAKKKLEDCLEELELTAEEEVDFQFAECFVLTPTEQAKELTEARLGQTKALLDKKAAQRADLKRQIDKLKGELYAKFGNNINLEE